MTSRAKDTQRKVDHGVNSEIRRHINQLELTASILCRKEELPYVHVWTTRMQQKEQGTRLCKRRTTTMIAQLRSLSSKQYVEEINYWNPSFKSFRVGKGNNRKVNLKSSFFSFFAFTGMYCLIYGKNFNIWLGSKTGYHWIFRAYVVSKAFKKCWLSGLVQYYKLIIC